MRASAWGTRLRPATSPTNVSETEKRRIRISFLVCQLRHRAHDAIAVCQRVTFADSALQPMPPGNGAAVPLRADVTHMMTRSMTRFVMPANGGRPQDGPGPAIGTWGMQWHRWAGARGVLGLWGAGCPRGRVWHIPPALCDASWRAWYRPRGACCWWSSTRRNCPGTQQSVRGRREKRPGFLSPGAGAREWLVVAPGL